MEKYQVSNPADVDGDCVDDITELNNLGVMNPISAGIVLDPDDGAGAVLDWDSYVELSYSRNLLRWIVKYIMFEVDTKQPRIYFMKTSKWDDHQSFRDQVLGRIGEHLRMPETFHGRISYSEDLIGPDGTPGIYAFTMGSRRQPFNEIERMHSLLAASMPFLRDNLAFWLEARHLQYYQPDLPLLRESRIPLVFDEDIYGDIDFLALNPAVGYGRLRVLDPDETPHTRDIALYGALPNELPRVAGVISTVPQTPLSHINLRAVQNGIPNGFIRDALDDSSISDLVDGYVRYEVTSKGWSLRATTKAEVDAHYESSRPTSTQVPVRDLSATTITSLGDIGFDDWDSFGVKAANLAVLRTLEFPDGTVPDGFAVPFYFYDEFMEANGLYDDVREMLADEDFQSDYEEQEDQLKDLRKAIKKADQSAVDHRRSDHDARDVP